MWACTRPMDSRLIAHFQSFIERFPGVSDWEIVDGSIRGQTSSLRRVRQVTRGDIPLVAAGFSTIQLLSAARRRATVYCPSGIPEERLLHGRSAKNRINTALSWALLRAAREPEMTLTVSTRMSDLFRRRTGWSTFEAAPLSVDRSIFHPGTDGHRLVYLGTGAAWQGMDLLAGTWQEVARSIPSAEFRVISRDERTQVLVDAVGPHRCDTVAADQPEDVAKALLDCRVGFVLRDDHVVNRVAYPTKIGEYLATSTSVVTSDVDWDPGDLVRDVGCGTLLRPGAEPLEIAKAVHELLDRDRDDLAERCTRGADALDRASWVEHLAARLPHASGAG